MITAMNITLIIAIILFIPTAIIGIWIAIRTTMGDDVSSVTIIVFVILLILSILMVCVSRWLIPFICSFY
jgi:hypothetical protein